MHLWKKSELQSLYGNEAIRKVLGVLSDVGR